ncbi:MAG TPA: metallophosphoesterase [Rhodopila sp.]|uniref:metallophosphoesterase n=1 Tax=Rhodopila sp. TaxID=2480087 RepID=UPI002C3031BD|nr:metallophosphoesterase [Rhodopila sp.]HVY14060.1 metallophosphoesterase [Rhodopila sp.]
MKRTLRRPAMRSALDAAAIPTYAGPRPVAERADALHIIQAPGRLPRGRRVYAIGDVHGHLERLRTVHRMIADDLTVRPVPNAVLVHLGDYIDQGPDSAGVLRHLAGLRLPGVQVVNLMGDHERMLLDAIDGDRAAATDWLWAGGRGALASWGLPQDLPREVWAEAFPPEQIDFLRGLVLMHQEGDYLFVHAGVRPGVALRDQAREDLLMIRQPFLASEAAFGAVVVHGHSSNPAVPILGNRIGLDTGAGIGGRLTCGVLEEDGIALMVG